jgi:hypothetical protein
MGVIDFLKRTFGIKSRADLSLPFRMKIASLSIAVSVRGEAAIAKIDRFIKKCGEEESFHSKYPNMTAMAAQKLVDDLDSGFFKSPDIIEKMSELNTSVENKADAVFFRNLIKALASISETAASLPKMFENPVSFEKKTGVDACRVIVSRIKGLIEALGDIEKEIHALAK